MGYFWTPLEYKLTSSFSIIQACIRLDNFCVQHRFPISNRGAMASCALIENEGALIEDFWREGSEPDVVWSRNTIGNALR
jgi:isochorismate hydrolase